MVSGVEIMNFTTCIPALCDFGSGTVNSPAEPLALHLSAAAVAPMRYRAYSRGNFRTLPQVCEHLSEAQRRDIELISLVFPFKTNNYVVERLIDWSRVPDDPMFILNFPQRRMLRARHRHRLETALAQGLEGAALAAVVDDIRCELNPHPDGQLEHNVPLLDGESLGGMQHKYRETVLFFPRQGQTCHAYCSFCFRWPQFTGREDLRFASWEGEALVAYLAGQPQVTDVLFTGGDPLVMSARVLRSYLEPLLKADLPGLQNIRLGTKSLSYWPHRYLTDRDADELLTLFRDVTASGRQLALMAHFNHPAELATPAVQAAVRRVRDTGAVIRSQSPLLDHINAAPDLLALKWRYEAALGIVPYYTFVVRDTGAQQYFGVPLTRAWEIFQAAYRQVSGLCRTVRGPSMSADPGKVELLGPAEVGGERALALRFIQGRNPDWVGRPFFARWDEAALWLDDLRPLEGDSFFFTDELKVLHRDDRPSGAME